MQIVSGRRARHWAKPRCPRLLPSPPLPSVVQVLLRCDTPGYCEYLAETCVSESVHHLVSPILETRNQILARFWSTFVDSGIFDHSSAGNQADLLSFHVQRVSMPGWDWEIPWGPRWRGSPAREGQVIDLRGSAF